MLQKDFSAPKSDWLFVKLNFEVSSSKNDSTGTLRMMTDPGCLRYRSCHDTENAWNSGILLSLRKCMVTDVASRCSSDLEIIHAIRSIEHTLHGPTIVDQDDLVLKISLACIHLAAVPQSQGSKRGPLHVTRTGLAE